MTVCFSLCRCVARCHVPAGLHPLANDDRRGRSRQSAGDHPPAKPLANPQVPRTRAPASALKARACRRRSARTEAGGDALSTAPSHTGSPPQQRSDTVCPQRGRPTVALPSLAVCLWHHRPGGAGGFPMRPLLHPFCAVWPGREHGRRAADGRSGLGTSRSRLSSDGHRGCASPAVGSLHGFFEDSLPYPLLGNNSIKFYDQFHLDLEKGRTVLPALLRR
jgi:hypothetical protein